MDINVFEILNISESLSKALPKQPLGTDPLASPDHALSHRVFSNTETSPAMSVIVGENGDVFIPKTIEASNLNGINSGDQIADGVSMGGSGTVIDPFRVKSENSVTGIVLGGVLSINGTDNTKVDVSPGTAQYADYTDPLNPVITRITWTTTLTSNAGILGSNRTKWVGIQNNGGTPVIIAQTGFTPLDERTIVVLGKIRNSSGAGPVITAIDDFPHPTIGFLDSLREYYQARGSFIVSGNVITATTSLQLNKASGTSWRYSTQRVFGFENMHVDSAQVPRTTYSYQLRGSISTTNLSSLDPENYDLSGVLTPVPANKYTRQDCYYFPVSGSWQIVRGGSYYNKLSEAENDAMEGIPSENAEMLDGSVRICSIIFKQGTTDLQAAITAGTAKIYQEGPLNPSGGGSGDVVGPSSAVDNNIAVFDTTTGKIIKDGGNSIQDLKNLSIVMAIALG